MKILLLHEFYRTSAPSGEDNVVRQERELLEQAGHEVVTFERHNDEIDDSTLAKRIRLGVETIWSERCAREIRAELDRVQPDLVHIHNTFPLISPSAYHAIASRALPIVQTLHNFRLICAEPMLMRNGVPCEACVGRLPLPALRHRCYRGSLAATAPLALSIGGHRIAGTYRRLIHRYIALTQFAKARFVAGGLAQERIAIKPNFLAEPPQAGEGRGGFILFVGRLRGEKGVATLLEAWQRLPELPLKILGDGELRLELEQRGKSAGVKVEFLGFRPRHEVLDLMRSAEMLVVPSLWYEGFPLVVLEAFACGTPVIASALGGLDEIVNEGVNGLKFPPGDARALANAVERLTSDLALRQRMRQAARATFDEHYSASRNLDQLLAIYRDAIRSAGRAQPRSDS